MSSAVETSLITFRFLSCESPSKQTPGAYETGGEDVHDGHDPAIPFDSYHFESASLELIYRVLSPYKHPIGLALYFESAVGDQETELEFKLLLQKNWFEDARHAKRTREPIVFV